MSTERMQVTSRAARFDDYRWLSPPIIDALASRTTPQQEVSLQPNRLLNAQHRGHARNAQAKVGEVKGGLCPHADLWATKGRCRHPRHASGRVSDRQVADELNGCGSGFGQGEGQTTHIARDKHRLRVTLGLQ